MGKERQRDQLPDNYKLLDVLKENQFGASYLVSEPKRQQWLVVKKQQIAYEGNAYITATALAKLSHPHIARIHGTARNDRVFIVVMEYVTGGSLQERLTQAFSLDRWLLLAQQICKGLHEAHQLGLLHGNLRPSNILVETSTHIKLTDFGFDDHSVGTGIDWYQPLHEQCSVASDIFSAGAVLFHLLTGEIILQNGKGIKNIDALSILPGPLEKIVSKMLAVNPDKRYSNIEQVRVALQTFCETEETIKIQAEPAQDKLHRGNKRWHRLAKAGLILAGLFFVAEIFWLLDLFGPLRDAIGL
ncbi:serine/threonine-protein kinase [Oceanicoccus sp. KOV_DT_Chl]|uniref:serine/threonine protein kinase n=1 Tax=Oceanicoccus sp. KOV_DT_Chl TaxID=1904639 RepID=UPI000C7BB95C|nr:serine/threonine-protein kinase [Oceanicoccus sp. KOV_DT_Chl]